AVAPPGGPLPGRGRCAADPDRHPAPGGPGGATLVGRALAVEGGAQRLERLVDQGTLVAAVDVERRGPALGAARAHAEDRAAAGAGVERGPLLRRQERVPQRLTAEVAEQADPLGAGGQPREGGEGVAPRR